MPKKGLRGADPDPERKAAPTQDEEALLAAVYANPEDDAARLVYADCLQERDDPRGEMIALSFKAIQQSLTKHDKRTLTALIRRHERDWIGPLFDATLKSSREYERGFLSKCTMNGMALRQRDAALNHVAWSTVKELDLGNAFAMGMELLMQPNAGKSLRVIKGVSRDDVVMLARMGAQPFRLVEKIEIDDAQSPSVLPLTGSEAVKALNAPAGLPNLVELRMPSSNTPDGLAFLSGTTLGQRLKRIHVPLRVQDPAQFAWALNTLKMDIGAEIVATRTYWREATNQYEDESFTIVRNEAGRWAVR
jgi:uncharacterized protein (TIGR02996 family)